MSNDDVEAVYASLEALCLEARLKKYRIAIAGDFNAEVGAHEEFDDASIIGHSSMTTRSDRGDMLVKWCTQHGFSLANTFSDADIDDAWTYRNGASRKMLDHMLLDCALMAFMSSCVVLAPVDTGSDHRPQMLVLSGRKFSTKSPKKKRRCPKSWRPDNTYKERILGLLTERPHQQAPVAEKAAFIHEAMLKAVEETCVHTESAPTPSKHPLDVSIAALIETRRSLAHSALSMEEVKKQRKQLGKDIQKNIRKKLAEQRVTKMQKVLAEFKDLNRLINISGVKSNRSISEIVDANGVPQQCNEDIAEVFACFYENLYKTTRDNRSAGTYAAIGEGIIPSFTLKELQGALKQMRLGRARDMSGIVVEMLKLDCEPLHALILEVFNDVLSPDAEPPCD